MKTLTLNLEKKLVILDYGTKEKLDKAWNYCKSFSTPREIFVGSKTEKGKAIFKGTFMGEEDYRSLIADEDVGISISKHPLAYLVSYSRHENAFRDIIEKEGFYWLENPMGEKPEITDKQYEKEYEFIQNNPEEHIYGDHYADWSLWKEAEAHTLRFPIIFEILEE